MLQKLLAVLITTTLTFGSVGPVTAQVAGPNPNGAPGTPSQPLPNASVPAPPSPNTPSAPQSAPQSPNAAQAPAAPAAGPNAAAPAPQPAPQAQKPLPPGVNQQTQAGSGPQRPALPERRLLPPPTVARGGGMVSLNFNRADLVEVIHIIAQQLGLNYTIDPDVKGTVTINSAQPLSTEDLLPIFHQVLRMNGAIAVKSGNLYRITTIKDGKGLVRPVGQSKEDSFALQIVPVRFFSVAEMKKVLTPFLQPGGELIENPRGNFLIIMDLPSNIQRLMEIADLIDVQVFAGTRMEIYQPKIASAEELAQEMTKVMQSFASSAPQPDSFAAQFIALPRINQVLVISHSEAAWTYAKRWLDRIDVVAEGPGRRIFIYPVENGKATELADVLNQALGQPSMGTRSQTQTLQDLHRFTTSSGSGQTGSSFGGSSFGQPGTRSPSSFSNPSGMTGGYPYAQAAVAAPGQVPPPAAPPSAPGVVPPRPPTPAAQQQKAEEQLRIVADPATNSLIIFGTAQEFQNIKTILKDLDQVPRQVLLDVLVAEVTLSDTQSFGIEYEIFSKFNPTIFGQQFGSTGAVRSGLVPQQPTDSTGAVTGLAQFGNGISGIIGRSNAIKAFINALQTDSRLKVLSSPSILATDNRPARIQVGSEDPIATGSTTVQVGTAASSTSIQYRNTGRIVTVIPQVNAQGLVNLQILAEVSQPGDLVQVGPDKFPSFLTRQAETTAVVQDGDTLVIGGIITDNKTRSRTGIPYLMDLPVLGRFFGTTNDKSDRTELIMLITPHVVRNRDDAKLITEEFKNSLGTVRNELERMTREKEKLLQSAPPPLPQPAVPGPSGDQPPAPNLPATPPAGKAPAPAPSASAAPDGSKKPMKEVIFGPSGSPISADADTMPLPQKTSAGSLLEAYNAPTSAHKNEQPRPAPVVKPAVLALAVTGKEHAPAGAAQKPAGAKPPHIWQVQVASFSRERDAEALASDLRALGYDAFTEAAEVNTKLWHRVRVGKAARLEEAVALQKKLKTNQKFEQAYVTR